MAKIMRRKYICTNNVVEVTQYVVGDKTQGSPRWRKAKSQDDKRDENARQAVRVAARILNCNYTPEDWLLTLTWSDEKWKKLVEEVEIATSPAAPRNDTDLLLDRAREVLAGKLDQVRRMAKKQGVEVKSFAVTSDLDQETGELVRVHHHVVINAAGKDLLEQKWDMGLVHCENLYRQDDYTPLAAYLLGQVRHRENRKKYACSRNMVQPKVEEMVIAECPESEIRVQPGAKVLDRSPYREGAMSQYVRYKRKTGARKRGGKKLGEALGTDCHVGLRPPRNDREIGGRSEFCKDKSAAGGSGYEFSKIAWG